MNHPKNAYIALGSNKGSKFDNLQEALTAIHNQVGTIRSISKIYKTEAIGFEGDDFFNACVLVETALKPKKLLKVLLQIEKDLGRERSKKEGYQSRTIDLDIIFYDDDDYREYLVFLKHNAEKHECLIHAYVLMTNHVHTCEEVVIENLKNIRIQVYNF